MKNLKLIVLSFLLGGVSNNVLAEPEEYHVDSKLLTIPIVKIGDSFVYDAKLRLNEAGSFDIVGYSATPTSVVSSDGVAEECTKDKISFDKVSQLSQGMTFDQMNSIVGCKGRVFSTAITWSVGGSGGLPELPELFVLMLDDTNSIVEYSAF